MFSPSFIPSLFRPSKMYLTSHNATRCHARNAVFYHVILSTGYDRFNQVSWARSCLSSRTAATAISCCLLTNINRLLSSHGLLQIVRTHAWLSLRNNNLELIKNDMQQPTSEPSELVWLTSKISGRKSSTRNPLLLQLEKHFHHHQRLAQLPNNSFQRFILRS